jgi:FtsH-binding integral membrane protein
MRRKYRAQRAVAGGIFGIGAGVVALSLGHLTQGVIDHTGSDLWQAGLMAAGIDLLMLAHKAGAMVAATEAVRRKIWPWTTATVIGTSLMSAYMNAFEFAQHAVGTLQFYGGIVLGCAIPALVYASLVVGFYMWSMAGREA